MATPQPAALGLAPAPDRRPRALVFFDLDMTIRHFLKSGAFEELQRDYDVTYIFHIDSTSRKKNIHSDLSELPGVRKIELDVPRKRGGTWDLLSVAGMMRHAGHLPNFVPLARLYRILYSPRLIRFLRFASLPGIFELFRLLVMRRLGANDALLDLIAREKPDILIHPTVLVGLLIDDLVVASRRTGVPLVCLMNSWDNPSQKRIAAGAPSKLVVWGEQGRRHALDYFGMPSGDIVVGGAAQFDVYRRPIGRTKAELHAEFGTSGDKPVVLYAGCSKGVIESGHLKLLDDAIESGAMPPCQIVYRPHPWKSRLMPGEADFRTLGLKNVVIDPHMAAYYDRIARGTVDGFQLADYSATVRVLHLVDAVVSPLSTMMVEAALCGKPVLCLTTEADFFHPLLTMRDMRALVHFAEFFEAPGIHECWDAAKLPESCRRLMADALDPVAVQRLKDHARFFVELDGRSYAARLRDLADELIGRAQTGQEIPLHATA